MNLSDTESESLVIIIPIALIIIFAISYFTLRVKCINCGNRGLLNVNDKGDLECKKCKYNYGPDDFDP